MTPIEYRKRILPLLTDVFKDRCICNFRGLRSIISFSFLKYNIGPTALMDSEILIQEYLRENRSYRKVLMEDRGFDFKCAACGSMLREHYEEYSINMSNSFVEYDRCDGDSIPYLIGFYGFNADDFARISDFYKTDKEDFYVSYLTSMG